MVHRILFVSPFHTWLQSSRHPISENSIWKSSIWQTGLMIYSHLNSCSFMNYKLLKNIGALKRFTHRNQKLFFTYLFWKDVFPLFKIKQLILPCSDRIRSFRSCNMIIQTKLAFMVISLTQQSPHPWLFCWQGLRDGKWRPQKQLAVHWSLSQ